MEECVGWGCGGGYGLGSGGGYSLGGGGGVGWGVEEGVGWGVEEVVGWGGWGWAGGEVQELEGVGERVEFGEGKEKIVSVATYI